MVFAANQAIKATKNRSYHPYLPFYDTTGKMAGTMHGLDWLFAIGTLFFLLSAWSLGKCSLKDLLKLTASYGSLS